MTSFVAAYSFYKVSILEVSTPISELAKIQRDTCNPPVADNICGTLANLFERLQNSTSSEYLNASRKAPKYSWKHEYKQ